MPWCFYGPDLGLLGLSPDTRDRLDYTKSPYTRLAYYNNTCNNDKNLSEIQLEHEKEDELVVVVVKVVHELDCMMVVKEIEDGLFEEIEKFGWWFEQDISGESEDDSEKRLVMSKEEHEVHLKLVLESLRKEKMYAKFSNLGDALSRKERVKSRRVRGMILAAQSEAFKQENVLAERLHGLDQQMERKEDVSLYFMDRIWVPLIGGVRTRVMDEAHKTKYSVHPGADKMYYDLRDMYWWPGMKRDIATYVSLCLICSKIKAEHQRPSGLSQQPKIPEWKWDKITMDFITKLPMTKSGHDTIWVIVNRLTKSAHFLAMGEDYNTERFAKLYINEIVTRHGILDGLHHVAGKQCKEL
ncbi:putative reverse transcriptase domain-containing protein [Tanacetum coccineum]